MSLDKSAIKEFKKNYEKKFGQKISDQRALKLATNLINLYKAIYKSDRKQAPLNNNRKGNNNIITP